ncbi:MAG: Rpn family recombination-promoting nuclease/putative transposase [Proteobacteria bacterium]|nr:Rpn family recombination-promoting nuclease/putative transposase [Pseudomonadota bacterium]
MQTLRDIRDRIMKRMLRCPRMVRDLLELLPAAWTAVVDAASLTELPTEFIGERGDKRIADLCWLAEGGGGDSAIVLIENQSTPDWRMPARAMTRTGLLYETLGATARGPDGRFPPVVIVVVYTGHRPWQMPDDLTGLVRVPAQHPLPWLDGRRYARLDLRDVATQYPEQGNRMMALAGLTFAESVFVVNRLFADLCGWLDFNDEDETRLYQCYLDWLYAIEPRLRPSGWDPNRDRNLEELMAEQSILSRNTDRWLERYGREVFADGRRKGQADGRRDALVRLAARRFGADIGRRLGAWLENIDDPSILDRVGDLIVDCETGDQLLASIDRTDANSS